MLIIKKDNIPPITNPPILSNNEDNPNVKIASNDFVGLTSRLDINIVSDINTK